MTTAEDRRSAWRVVLRCTRAVVIALVVVLAVLVHHETVAPMTHVPSSRTVEAVGMTGMDHGSVPPARSHSAAPAPLANAAAPVSLGSDGACTGAGMQHCSAAGVDTVKLVPPSEPAVNHALAVPSRAAAGRDVPGTVGRAPPDLSLLSRLLL
ncbi:hypothetical protein [Streptomyces sp. NPDC001020]